MARYYDSQTEADKRYQQKPERKELYKWRRVVQFKDTHELMQFDLLCTKLNTSALKIIRQWIESNKDIKII